MPRPESLRAQHAQSQSSEFSSHTRSRRPSYNAKRNSMHHSRSEYSGLRAAATECPRDIDAFSFLPQYLSQWHMSDALWDAMPHHMRKHLAALQHAGAAAMTGFQRVEEMRKEFDGKNDEDNEDEHRAPNRTPSLTSLPSVPTSGAQSPQESVTMPCTPISHLDLGRGLALLPHDTKCSGPDELHPRPSLPSRPQSFNHFTTPASNPRIAQWRAEVSTLREETVVRMRHAMRKVESEWYAILYQHQCSPPKDPVHAEAWEILITEFTGWLQQKKAAVSHLDNRAKGLGMPLVLGWSDA